MSDIPTSEANELETADIKMVAVAPDIFIKAVLDGDTMYNEIQVCDYGSVVVVMNDENTPFQDENGTVGDPDVVYLILSVNGAAPTTYQYIRGVGDTSGTIVKTATGFYKARLSSLTLGSGTWQIIMGCKPSASVNLDSLKIQSTDELEVYVRASKIAPWPTLT